MLNLNYYLTLNEKQVVVYSGRNLAKVQEFINFEEPIINVYFLSVKNTLIILCKKKLFFYNCVFTKVGTIKFFKKLDFGFLK